MSHVEQTIDVDVPVNIVYNQWTQFEDFPEFMGGVDEVHQIDATHLHWVASIAGIRREWDSQILEQVPDRRVSWTNVDGAVNRGTVSFEPVAPQTTRVTLQLDFEPEGIVENVGDTLGLVAGQAKADLERFRDFITARGLETGAWRGEVHAGLAQTPPVAEPRPDPGYRLADNPHDVDPRGYRADDPGYRDDDEGLRLDAGPRGEERMGEDERMLDDRNRMLDEGGPS